MRLTIFFVLVTSSGLLWGCKTEENRQATQQATKAQNVKNRIVSSEDMQSTNRGQPRESKKTGAVNKSTEPTVVAQLEKNKETGDKSRPQPKTTRAEKVDRHKQQNEPVKKQKNTGTQKDELLVPELKPVKVPEFEYPPFTGKKVCVIHSANVMGQLDPSG